MTTLCELSTKLPKLVGTILDRESRLNRGRFREETLTDIITAALAAFAGPDLVIEYPDEAVTGSDLDLEFVHIAFGKVLKLRIQAKRLNAAKYGGRAVKVKNRAYSELLHQVPGTGIHQFRTLTDPTSSFLPLYMFYNHGDVTRDPEFYKTVPTVSGINLAFAKDVAAEMETELMAKPKRPNHKRLFNLRRHFFDLDAILCPSSPSGKQMFRVPSPDLVAESLRVIWMRDAYGTMPDEWSRFRTLSMPQSISSLTSTESRIADGPAIRINRDLQRTRITFITGRTEDDQTLKIFDNPQ